MWLVTGAVTYATLYTFALVMMTDRGWLGAVLMLPATLWSGVFAMALTVEQGMFREAKAATTNYIMAKTAVQIIVVWSLILVVFPYVITVFEDKLGIERLTFAGQKLIGGILFVLVSIPGVWSAVVMSRIGKGTPLPLDHAKELVIQGPYSYVRNPMAVSGIMQGLAVALFLGSPLVAIYALMGSAIWQLIFRPLEEDELEARFGKPYQIYRDSVRCWIPTLAAYQIEGTVDSSNSVEVPSGRI
jgi:protein-S-isoprenylcysteine O-methyltransferase Ste14